MNPEAWVAVVGIGLGLVVALVRWMGAINSKLASIDSSLKSLSVLWKRVDRHEERINGHEVAIGTIRESHAMMTEMIKKTSHGRESRDCE